MPDSRADDRTRLPCVRHGLSTTRGTRRVFRKDLGRLRRTYAAKPDGITRMHARDTEKLVEVIALWVRH